MGFVCGLAQYEQETIEVRNGGKKARYENDAVVFSSKYLVAA